MDVSDHLSKRDILELTALREVFGGFAHEIAQPLNAMMIATQVLQLRIQRSSLTEEEKGLFVQRLGIVLSQVQRVAHIVEDLRGFTRAKVPSLEQADIKTVFEKIRALMGQQFAGRGIELQMESHDPLPVLLEQSHDCGLVLVQALAFARDTVQAVGEWYEQRGIGYKKSVAVVLMPAREGSAVKISWSCGELFGDTFLLDPSQRPGLAAGRSLLESRGGNLKVLPNAIHITIS